jgi:hypothetical protein
LKKQLFAAVETAGFPLFGVNKLQRVSSRHIRVVELGLSRSARLRTLGEGLARS